VTTTLRARAILFDMDGTLVDSTAIVERVWGRFADEHGVSIADIMRTSHGVKAHDTIRRHGPRGIDVDVAAADLAAFEIEQTDGLIEIAGAGRFVEQVPESGFALVTSAPHALARKRLELCGIRVPSVVVAAEDVAHGKPDPEPYLTAAAALGIKPVDCVVFEDAAAGIHSALAAGMRVVVVGGITDDVAHGLTRIVDYTGSSIARVDETGFSIVLGN